MSEINLTAKGKEQELVLAYLRENASDILADKINNGVPHTKDGKQLINKKDLDGFMKHACEEAKELAEKGARSACVEDSVVYGWAIHYFEEDSVVGKLFNPDGTEYAPAPVKKQAAKPATPTPTPTPQKPKSQFSFFDMLNDKKDEIKDRTDDSELPDPTVDEIADSLQAALDEKRSVAEQPKKTLAEAWCDRYSDYARRYPDSVIVMRDGDFYEILGKNAVALGNKYDITITSRNCNGARLPMIGIPHHAADSYFARFRKDGKLVVVDSETDVKFLPQYALEDMIDDSVDDIDDDLSEEEMRRFDGDVQEPENIPDNTDCPYDEAALAKVIKLLGNEFILR